MATFPALTPTAMSFAAPEFPVRANTSLSGVTSRRLFGNRGSKATLDLSFDNITDSVAADIFAAWNDGQGQFDALTVPAALFNGAAADLLVYLAEGGDDLTWHFASPPQLQRVAPGISSVRVALEATRDA